MTNVTLIVHTMATKRDTTSKRADAEDPMGFDSFDILKCNGVDRQGTYTLEFSRCDSPDCKYCGPLRSKYRDVLGARFLPAVVPFTQSDDYPGLQPAIPGTASAKHFPDIFAVRALVPNAHEIPSELYLPRRKNVDFGALKCPFGCGVVFVTKAALQRHRVRMHKYKRTPTDLPNEQFSYIPLFDDVVEIVKRANPNSKEFVVKTTYNTFEWRTLPLDHEMVKTFIEKAAGEAEGEMPEGLPLVNLERWVAGGAIIGEEEDENEMTDE